MRNVHHLPNPRVPFFGKRRLRVDVFKLLYDALHLAGGFTLLAPDKTIDYSQTQAFGKYAFTF